MNAVDSLLLASLRVLVHHALATLSFSKQFSGSGSLQVCSRGLICFFCLPFLANFSGFNLNMPSTEKTSLTIYILLSHPSIPSSSSIVFSDSTLLFHHSWCSLCLFGCWLLSAPTSKGRDTFCLVSTASPAPSRVPGVWMLRVAEGVKVLLTEG